MRGVELGASVRGRRCRGCGRGGWSGLLPRGRRLLLSLGGSVLVGGGRWVEGGEWVVVKKGRVTEYLQQRNGIRGG